MIRMWDTLVMEELAYIKQQQQGDYLDMAALLSMCVQGELLIPKNKRLNSLFFS